LPEPLVGGRYHTCSFHAAKIQNILELTKHFEEIVATLPPLLQPRNSLCISQIHKGGMVARNACKFVANLESPY